MSLNPVILAIPMYFTLMGVELVYEAVTNRKTYRLNDAVTNISTGTLQQLTKTYGNLVTMPIPNTVRVAEAPASGGRTVIEYAPESPASTAYWNLVDTIFNGVGGDA